MMENIIDIIGFLILTYLAFYIWGLIEGMKLFHKAVEFRLVCDSTQLVGIRGGNVTIKLEEKVVVKENLLKLENFYCKIPRACREFEGKGKILIEKDGDCLEFRVVS